MRDVILQVLAVLVKFASIMPMSSNALIYEKGLRTLSNTGIYNFLGHFCHMSDSRLVNQITLGWQMGKHPRKNSTKME